MSKLLSVVIPVYKTEKYIRKCLDSLFIYKEENGVKIVDEELMNLLDVLIINDGTPDRAAEISREYVAKFPNIFRQIDKNNGGSGSCRNLGLKEAKGKYLRFLDSDDWFTNFERLINDLLDCDADIVFNAVNIVHMLAEEIEFIPQTPPYNVSLSIDEYAPKYNKYWATNFWYAAYKTNMLKKAYPLFLEKVSYVDSILFEAPLVLADSFLSLDYAVYNYLDGREGQSMSKDVMKVKITDRFKAVKHQENFILSHCSKHISMNDWCREIVWHEYLRIIPAIYELVPEDKYHLLRIFKKYQPVFPYNEKYNLANKLQKRFIKYPFWIFRLYEFVREVSHKMKGV